MSENYPKALAFCIVDNTENGGGWLGEKVVRQALDDLGLKLISQEEWRRILLNMELLDEIIAEQELRGGPDPEGATASRHPGDN